MKTVGKRFLIIGIVFAIIGVALGAFGAHGFHDYLEIAGRRHRFDTAITYLWYHTFAILIVGVLSSTKSIKLFNYAGIGFTSGILLFSGSLLLLMQWQNIIIGLMTPLGGLMFILSWFMLLLGVIKKPN